MRSTRLLLLPLALAACKTSGADTNKKGPAKDPVAQVALTKVTLAPTPELLTLTGTIVPEESSEVAADVAGKVVAVMVERGQVVKAGDALLRLDTRNAQLGAREARANLNAARAQRQLAQDECARAQSLFDKGAITKSQFEREQTSCTAALQGVAAAEARTQMITKSISDGIVRAPFGGTVSDRWISPGEFVGPGVKLVTLVDADPLRVELTVPEAAVPRLTVGQEVQVTAVAWRDKTFTAKVSRIGAEIGRQSRALIAEATLDPGSPLVPGMFVEARLVVDKKPQPVVPETAVVKRGQTHRVFLLVGDRLEERVVQLGAPPGPGQVSILKGLADGDQVATTIDAKVTDGLKVK